MAGTGLRPATGLQEKKTVGILNHLGYVSAGDVSAGDHVT